jgi:hypothetical protein
MDETFMGANAESSDELNWLGLHGKRVLCRSRLGVTQRLLSRAKVTMASPGESSGPIGEGDMGGEDDRWSSRARRVIVIN